MMERDLVAVPRRGPAPHPEVVHPEVVHPEAAHPEAVHQEVAHQLSVALSVLDSGCSCSCRCTSHSCDFYFYLSWDHPWQGQAGRTGGLLDHLVVASSEEVDSAVDTLEVDVRSMDLVQAAFHRNHRVDSRVVDNQAANVAEAVHKVLRMHLEGHADSSLVAADADSPEVDPSVVGGLRLEADAWEVVLVEAHPVQVGVLQDQVVELNLRGGDHLQTARVVLHQVLELDFHLLCPAGPVGLHHPAWAVQLLPALLGVATLHLVVAMPAHHREERRAAHQVDRQEDREEERHQVGVAFQDDHEAA